MNGPADRSDRPVDKVDADLRAAVRSFATGIEPADRLGEIRRAVATPPRRTRPWLLAGGAAVLAAAVVLGFVVLVNPTDDAGENTPVAATTSVTVYEVRSVDGRPWLQPTQVSTEDSEDAAHDAVSALLAFGSPRTNIWKACPGGELRSIDRSGEVVTVALTGTPGATCRTTPEALEAERQQLAWTVRDALGVDVSIVLETAGPDQPQPITADPNALSPVLLDSPTDGATVDSPLTVEGRGNTFEGNVQWEVLAGDQVVDEGFETAGTMGDFRPFSFTVDLEPGDYTVRVFEISMEDGSLFAEDTTTVTVE